MKGKSALMMKVLINRYHQGAPEVFLAGLDKDKAAAVMAVATSSQEPAKVIVDPLTALSNNSIHYSWLLPILENFSPGTKTHIINALPHPLNQRLAELTSTTLGLEPLAIVKEYFAHVLYSKLGIQKITPRPFLTETTLTPLLDFSKPQLINLIDYLGIYDVAQELRKVVDNKVVKAVYSTLTPKKLAFLKVCLHQKDKLIPEKMGLAEWKGDSQELLSVLHKRGLQRLGGALSGQHPDLLWHLSRRLDKGRGLMLMKNYSPKELPQKTPILGQHVLNTINFLKKMGEM